MFPENPDGTGEGMLLSFAFLLAVSLMFGSVAVYHERQQKTCTVIAAPTAVWPADGLAF